MSSSTKNDARVTARIPQQIKETLEQAATLSGATLNQFIVGAALKEAQQVLEAEKIFSLVEKPPTANEKLKAAVAKHQKFFNETD